MYCRVREASRNQIIYSQNEPAENVYIIKSGDFKVKETFLKKSLNKNSLFQILSKVDYHEAFESPDDLTIRKYLKKKYPSRDIEVQIFLEIQS